MNLILFQNYLMGAACLGFPAVLLGAGTARGTEVGVALLGSILILVFL